ncbi:hypothetical protein B0H10DRAFT_2213763 [Mycena sp. CBHHK59/15]|nr:hypothetical protein B0H10DRAFT_2213763 [Mycena sp. CBHHK59/15]
MQRRGRSRLVSDVALARAASEERIRCHRPGRAPPRTPPFDPSNRSPSPPSSASISPRSPASRRSPTPPPSLSDQVHIAYAHDDIHLAKVLLLRLQGINVTSDDDPRIAAVKDEDFDACFVPFGRLDDGRGDLSGTTTNNIKPPPDLDARRSDRLKACERIWDTEARRFSDERAKCVALKRQLDELLRAQSIEHDCLRLIKQKEAAAAVVDLRRRRMKPTARTLNFALVPPPPQAPPKFTYDFPFTPRNTTPRSAPRRSPPAPERERPAHALDPIRVPFTQVLASMHGELFPALPGERQLLAGRARARRERELLDALLDAGADLSPGRKGKGRAVDPASPESPKCVACSSPSPPSTPSTSSSGLSRAGSWLSFGSSSRASTSTSATSSSPPSSWVSASTLLSASAPAPKAVAWLPGARRTTSPSPLPLACQCAMRACASRSCPRTPVPAHEAPLPVPLPPDPPSATTNRHAQSSNAAMSPLPFTLALSRLVALARNLQTAYVHAVIVGYGGVSPEWDREPQEERLEERERVREKPALAMSMSRGMSMSRAVEPPIPRSAARVVRSIPRSAAPAMSTLRVKPAGYRAPPAAVRLFTSPHPSSASTCTSASTVSSTPADDDDAPAPVARLTPLVRTQRTRPTPAHRTQLPPRLPYATVFAPPQPLPRSPWASGGAPRPPTTGPVPCSAAAARARAQEVQAAAESKSEPESARVATPEAPCTIKCVPPDYASDNDTDGESGDERERPVRPVLRARAVPNSAFLRLKALHVHAHPRLQREWLVGLGVDHVPGSGLRFVYASTARGVVVGG